jgi:hypothetical protein
MGGRAETLKEGPTAFGGWLAVGRRQGQIGKIDVGRGMNPWGCM